MRDNNLSTTFSGGCHVVTGQWNDVDGGSFVYISNLENLMRITPKNVKLGLELSSNFD